MWPIVKIFSMWNCSIGSIIREASHGSPATPALCKQLVRLPLRSSGAAVRSHPCRPHHVDHPGHEAEQEKHDEPEGRCRQQTVETPAYPRTDNDAGDQLGR